MKRSIFCLLLIPILFGCDELTRPHKEQPGTEQASTAPARQAAASNGEMRFVFPTKSSPFLESSVALDTTTGRLCKTYAWEDNSHVPRGLPLCSELTAMAETSLTGATKAYRGFTYRFNGTKWVKGAAAKKYNENTQGMDPWSDDQYDPLNLYSKEEKAKRILTEAQIRKVAELFGVSYEEAWEEAKQQGYQVPPKR
ncbi:MAG: hypothetical protein ACRD2L_19545 [Terriglobia bacterium]